MLETLKPQPPDKIIELMGLYAPTRAPTSSTSGSGSTRTPRAARR